MTYEYQCTACGHDWEADQRISEPPLERCPECRKKTARRMVSGGAGFILKGGGWYSDGYASKGGTKQSPASGSPSTSPGDTPATASDSTSPKSPSAKKGDSTGKSAAA